MSTLILALVLSGKCPGGVCPVPAKTEQPAAVKHEKVHQHRRHFRLFRVRLFRGCKGC